MIRRAVLSAVSAVALASSAFAADVYSPGAVSYAPAIVPVATWAGFYIGANGGYGGYTSLPFRDSSYPAGSSVASFTINGGADITGGFGGGQLGYNFQTGNFVFGIETDIQGSDIRGRGAQNTLTGTADRFAAVDMNVDYFGTVRGKLGYSFGGVLLYATGGFAYGGVRSAFSYQDTFGFTGIVGNNQTETGWAAGGGIEVKMSPSWSLKGEYQFIDLSSNSTGFAALTPATFDQRGNVSRVEFNTVRVGVNYYFNTPYEPLPLK
jgi:outer membrane immunogenic protein